jgi:hypothetical protein
MKKKMGITKFVANGIDIRMLILMRHVFEDIFVV